MEPLESSHSLDFIRAMVADDLAAGAHGGQIVTRFPPEPNGYLHIGHAKAICIDFGLAEEVNAGRFGGDGRYVGRCHLRFDDTNPTKEEQRYIDGIKEDLRWLGFDWGEHEYHASDYFQTLYEWAQALIEAGLAYVDDQGAEQIRETRGTLTKPGQASPHRDRSAAESLDLFEQMKNGAFPDGSRVLRAKIDMASPNMNMRDPVMYRILKAVHPRTGSDWCIYPMYDWAHGQSDWIEGITHSLCSLEFEDHRPLYDWFIESLQRAGVRSPAGDDRPNQTEFSRLSLTYTIVTKRKLRELVEDGVVCSWDDPRLPTLSAMRRRGYPPAAIRNFCTDIGVSKREQVIEFNRLEGAVREELNKTAWRVMGVLHPLRVVIDNYPDGQVEGMDAINNPEDESAGKRTVPFSKVIYIERHDFMEDPPRKFFRLAPGREVRLRYGYWITCTDVVKDDAGEIVEVRATYDPQTRGGNNPPDGRKVKGTIHWVSAKRAVKAQVRLYDTLFAKSDPENAEEGQSWKDHLNPGSLTVIHDALVEPSLTDAKVGRCFQFERIGYFCVDRDSGAGGLVFNRTVTLRDSWARAQRG